MSVKRACVFLLVGLIGIFLFRVYKAKPRESFVDHPQEISVEMRESESGKGKLQKTNIQSVSSENSTAAESLGGSHIPKPIANDRVDSAEKTGFSKPVGSSSAIPGSTEVVATRSFDHPATTGIVIPPKDAKGGVYALYRAVLWRDPDPDGGRNATNLFSTIGWSTYIENSRNMISSPEFEERIVPNHDTVSIINRIYSVFLGRCPNEAELSTHFEHVENKEPGQITETVLKQVKPADVQQIFLGGYSPFLCTTKK